MSIYVMIDRLLIPLTFRQRLILIETIALLKLESRMRCYIIV